MTIVYLLQSFGIECELEGLGKSSGVEIIASENLCGPNSLLMAARLVGVDISPEQVDRLLPSDRGACSMLELKDSALKLGLACRPVRWAPSKRPITSQPAIIALKLNDAQRLHYVVLADHVGDYYQIIDFGRSPKLIHFD